MANRRYVQWRAFNRRGRNKSVKTWAACSATTITTEQVFRLRSSRSATSNYWAFPLAQSQDRNLDDQERKLCAHSSTIIRSMKGNPSVTDYYTDCINRLENIHQGLKYPMHSPFKEQPTFKMIYVWAADYSIYRINNPSPSRHDSLFDYIFRVAKTFDRQWKLVSNATD